MKKIAPVAIAIVVAFLVTPLVFLIFAPGLQDVASDSWELFLVGLFLTPIIVAFIGALIVSLHPRSYRFQPVAPVQRENDPVRHAATGFCQAVLQDFSRGVIAVPEMYSPTLSAQVQQELERLRAWTQQGFRFQFAFHHTEVYDAHVLHVLGQHEFVVEIDGLFDYFFEKAGAIFTAPHQPQGSHALIRVPAVIRLRIVRDEHTNHWQLVGFYDSITGTQLGLATQ